MTQESDTLKKEYEKIVKSLICCVSPEDYKRFESHMPYILEMSRIENRSVALYDVSQKSFLLKVDKHLQILGYREEEMDIDDIDGFHAMVHPDDLPFLYDSEMQMYEYLKKTSIEEKKNYKLVYDFRVRDKSGTYIRFLHQLTIFELDKKGNSWILLVISDVISTYPSNDSPRRFLIHTKTKTVCLFNEESGIKSKLVTKREKEVLELISEGLVSQEIADTLSISIHTVNNHRQNILCKTKTKNVAQAIFYLKCIGLM